MALAEANTEYHTYAPAFDWLRTLISSPSDAYGGKKTIGQTSCVPPQECTVGIVGTGLPVMNLHEPTMREQHNEGLKRGCALDLKEERVVYVAFFSVTFRTFPVAHKFT